MSVQAAEVLKVTPFAAAGTAIPDNGSAFAFGTWLEMIAATAAPTTLLGVTWIGGGSSGNTGDVEIGIGAAGSEVAIGSMRIAGSSGNAGPSFYPFRIPIGGIGTGVRVSLRIRSNGFSAVELALQYLESYSGTHTTTTEPLNSTPKGAVGYTWTPSAVAWTSSSPIEIIPATSEQLAWVGFSFVMGTGTGDIDLEMDLMLGAAGAETVVSTLRGSILGGQGFSYLHLPIVYPIAIGERVSVRARKSDTNTNAWAITGVYYGSVHLLPGGCFGGGTITIAPDPADGETFTGRTLAPRSWLTIGFDDEDRSFALDSYGHDAVAAAGLPLRLAGLAAPVLVWSDPAFTRGEAHRFAPGCFADALRHEVRLLVEHCDAWQIATTADGSLLVGEGRDGLLFAADLPRSGLAERVVAAVAAGIAQHCCIRVAWDRTTAVYDAGRVTITRVVRADISILLVTDPCLPGTRIRVVR